MSRMQALRVSDTLQQQPCIQQASFKKATRKTGEYYPITVFSIVADFYLLSLEEKYK